MKKAVNKTTKADTGVKAKKGTKRVAVNSGSVNTKVGIKGSASKILNSGYIKKYISALNTVAEIKSQEIQDVRENTARIIAAQKR